MIRNHLLKWASELVAPNYQAFLDAVMKLPVEDRECASALWGVDMTTERGERQAFDIIMAFSRLETARSHLGNELVSPMAFSDNLADRPVAQEIYRVRYQHFVGTPLYFRNLSLDTARVTAKAVREVHNYLIRRGDLTQGTVSVRVENEHHFSDDNAFSVMPPGSEIF